MIPKRPCAPDQPTRKPVITSSKTRSAPARVVSSRSISRKPAGAGGTTPMLPGDRLDDDGRESRRVRPDRRPRRPRGRCSRATTVRSRDALRHPRAVGDAERERAGAGAHQQSVGVAVVAAVELEDASRPVAARASRSALIVASVPELTSRTCSTPAARRRAASPARPRRPSARRSSCPGAICSRSRAEPPVRVAEDQRSPRADEVDVLDGRRDRRRTRPSPRAMNDRLARRRRARSAPGC